eukprot:1173813-Amorphochlora_amoeboformis.AAC.1
MFFRGARARCAIDPERRNGSRISPPLRPPLALRSRDQRVGRHCGCVKPSDMIVFRSAGSDSDINASGEAI